MNILPHKDWNPWGSKQIAKVKTDEAKHNESEAAKRKRAIAADNESRIDAMRKRHGGGGAGGAAATDLVVYKSSSGHTNFFVQEEEFLSRGGTTSGGNADAAVEKAEEALRIKRQQGIAPWALGEGSLESYGMGDSGLQRFRSVGPPTDDAAAVVAKGPGGLMPDASLPPWAQSEKDREKRRLKDLEHRRRVDPSNDIGRALALKAAAAKVSGAAAMGMSAGASGGEAVAVAKGEDKAAMLQRLRQQRLEREANERQREKQILGLVAPVPAPTFDSEDPLTGFSSTFRDSMQGAALSKDEVHQQRLEAKARRESARARPKSKFY